MNAAIRQGTDAFIFMVSVRMGHGLAWGSDRPLRSRPNRLESPSWRCASHRPAGPSGPLSRPRPPVVQQTHGDVPPPGAISRTL